MYSQTSEEAKSPLPSLAPPGFPALPSLFNANFTLNQHNLTTHHSSPNLMTHSAYPIMNYQACCWSQWNQPAMLMAAPSEPPPQRLRTLTSGGVEHNSALTKFQTKICDHWRRSGICAYGGSCWYAHGEDDLRKVNVSRSGGRMVVEEKSRESEQAKPTELPKAVGGVVPKRASTNVKGLTVHIPPNIAFKEQVSNTSSLPLSPAQERWISMSGGANPFAEKEQIEGQKEDEVAAPLDDYSILSPNPFPYQQTGFSGRMASSGSVGGASSSHPHHHHRSYSRGPHPKPHLVNSFGMLPQQQGTTNGQHLSRSGSVGGFGTYHQAVGTGSAQRSASSIRTSSVSAAPSQIGHTGSHPQYQQAIWNVAGEIYQRQKEIESNGGLTQQHQHQQKKLEEAAELNRLLAHQQAQQTAREYEAVSKIKDITYIKFMLDRGLLSKKQVPRELWNDLAALYSQQQHLHGSSAGGTDCQCGSLRHKESLDASPASFIHPNHPQARRPFMNPMAAELSAPPKIFESLLPSDNSFSIWLDPKPRKDASSIASGLRGGIVPSDSGASLLSKMDHLRSKKFPIDEEEIALATGRPIDGKEKAPFTLESSDESSSSPPVLSLIELLSSENLLDTSSSVTAEGEQKARKTTMFDFDGLNIVDSLKRMHTPSSVNSKPSSMSDSPRFAFALDEKNIGYDDAASGLFTPASTISGGGGSVIGQKPSPSFTEPCDFFVAGGSCPFGDSCHLSHSIPATSAFTVTERHRQQQQNAAI